MRKSLILCVVVTACGFTPANACSGTELDLPNGPICGEGADEQAVAHVVKHLGLRTSIEVYRVDERQSFAWIRSDAGQGRRFVTYFDDDAAHQRSTELGFLSGRYIQMHELAHHACGHVDAAYFDDQATTSAMELEADQFAGWAMQLGPVANGASLTKILSAASTFMDPEASGTHEGRRMRWHAFIQGWKHGLPSGCNSVRSLEALE